MFDFQVLYHTIFNPTDFGFISIMQMLKLLDKIIEVRNNVLYPKNEFELYANVAFNENVNIQVLLNILSLKIYKSGHNNHIFCDLHLTRIKQQ